MEKLLRNHGELCVLRHNLIVINTRLAFLLPFLVSTSCHIIIIFKPSFDLATVPPYRFSCCYCCCGWCVLLFFLRSSMSFFFPHLNAIFHVIFTNDEKFIPLRTATKRKRYENSTPNRWNEQKKTRKIKRTHSWMAWSEYCRKSINIKTRA